MDNRRASERPYYRDNDATGLVWLVGLSFVSGSMLGATLTIFLIL